jgi:hypothetical protein
MSGTISARPGLRIALLGLATAILLAGVAVAGLFGYLALGR